MTGRVRQQVTHTHGVITNSNSHKKGGTSKKREKKNPGKVKIIYLRAQRGKIKRLLISITEECEIFFPSSVGERQQVKRWWKFIVYSGVVRWSGGGGEGGEGVVVRRWWW